MKICIILAAGEGSRMKSDLIKVLHEINGKIMLKYVVDNVKAENFEKVIAVLGRDKEKVRERLKEDNIIIKEQKIGENEKYGTAYAASLAKEEVKPEDTVLILFGDTPLIDKKVIEGLMNYHEKNDNSLTVLSAELPDGEKYGRIIRDENAAFKAIVEAKEASKEELNIKEINSGIFVFKGEDYLYCMENIKNDNIKKEYYLTDAVSLLLKKGRRVDAYKSSDKNTVLGVNSNQDLAKIEKIVRQRINDIHMQNGVYMKDSERTYIEEDVVIGRDVKIYPDVYLEKGTVIGDNTTIYEGCRIVNSIIGKNCSIESSVIESSVVEDDVKIGPFAHLRPKSHIKKSVKIGNFVEVKNAVLGEGTKVGHLAYIGDADLGKNINVSCGVIFCNYDGSRKFRSKVGDNAFIGSNSNLIAPIEIGDNSYIAAGSTITQSVEAYALAIARSKQIEKKDWVKSKKEEEN